MSTMHENTVRYTSIKYKILYIRIKYTVKEYMLISAPVKVIRQTHINLQSTNFFNQILCLFLLYNQT